MNNAIKKYDEYVHILDDHLRGGPGFLRVHNEILGFVAYRYLSEKIENYWDEIFVKNDIVDYEEEYENNKEFREKIESESYKKLGYFIKPSSLFINLLSRGQNGENIMNELNDSLITINNTSNSAFNNIFSDVDLTNKYLGGSILTVNNRVTLIIFKDIANFDISIDGEVNFGDFFEYILFKISFVSINLLGNRIKPNCIYDLLTKCLILNNKSINNLYEPTAAAVFSLSTLKREGININKYYGEESSEKYYNLARLNLILHGVNYNDINIKNTDFIINNAFKEDKFDIISAIPQFKTLRKDLFIVDGDERFKTFNIPKRHGEYAYILHMLYHLKDNGTMGVIMPHGVLFRGLHEKTIREYLINNNYLDAVIGLPSKMFYDTSIPTVLLIFKKSRENKEIFFMDGSKHYEKSHRYYDKSINVMNENHINDIVQTYSNRENKDKFAFNVSLDEIKVNDYNLNIPRYINTFDKEYINLNNEINNINKLNLEINKNKSKINELCNQLNINEIYNMEDNE